MSLRSRNFAGALGLSSVLLIVLLAAVLPTAGGAAPEGQGIASSSSAVAAHVPAGCAQESATLESLMLSSTGEAAICPAASLPAPVSDVMRGGRTCRCSCGFPCKTDADCGGAIGSCRAGITCC